MCGVNCSGKVDYSSSCIFTSEERDENCCQSHLQYYGLFPLFPVDFFFNRFRSGWLGITCEEIFLVDPVCVQGNGTNETNLTVTLESQNHIPKNSREYDKQLLMEELGTFFLLVGNSPYHSALWLLPAGVVTFYTTLEFLPDIHNCNTWRSYGCYFATHTNASSLSLSLSLSSSSSLPLSLSSSSSLPISACSSMTDAVSCTPQCLSAGMQHCQNTINAWSGIAIRYEIFQMYLCLALMVTRCILVLELMIRLLLRMCSFYRPCLCVNPYQGCFSIFHRVTTSSSSSSSSSFVFQCVKYYRPFFMNARLNCATILCIIFIVVIISNIIECIHLAYSYLVLFVPVLARALYSLFLLHCIIISSLGLHVILTVHRRFYWDVKKVLLFHLSSNSQTQDYDGICIRIHIFFFYA
ncbi:hypothetical protein RFI_28164, partial [Reticulomyxa filosa]